MSKQELIEFYEDELDALKLIKASGNGDDELDSEIFEIQAKLNKLIG